jgi:hypothetical protein
VVRDGRRAAAREVRPETAYVRYVEFNVTLPTASEALVHVRLGAEADELPSGDAIETLMVRVVREDRSAG